MPSQTASKCHTICSPYKINLPGHMHSRRKQYADINSRCKACKGSEFSNCSAVILSLLETRYWGKHLLNLNAHLHKIPCLGTVKPFKFLLQERTSHQIAANEIRRQSHHFPKAPFLEQAILPINSLAYINNKITM